MPKTNDKPFTCPVEDCSGSGRSLLDLRRHINDRHLKCQTWKCPLCGFTATQHANSVRHLDGCFERSQDLQDGELSPISCSDARWPLLQEWEPGVDLPVLNDDGTAYMPEIPSSMRVSTRSGRDGHSKKPYDRQKGKQRLEQSAVPSVVLPPVSLPAAATTQDNGGQLRRYKLVKHIEEHTGRTVWQFKDYVGTPQSNLASGMATPMPTPFAFSAPNGVGLVPQTPVASTSKSQLDSDAFTSFQQPVAPAFDITQFMTANRVQLPVQQSALQGPELEMAQIMACLKAMAPPVASQSQFPAPVAAMQMPSVQNQLNLDLGTYTASLPPPNFLPQAQMPQQQPQQPQWPLNPQYLAQLIDQPAPIAAVQAPPPSDWAPGIAAYMNPVPELSSIGSSPVDSLLPTPSNIGQLTQFSGLPEIPIMTANDWQNYLACFGSQLNVPTNSFRS